MKNRRRSLVGAYIPLLAGVTLLAAVLRLHKLSDANPWFDEGFTSWLASLDTPAMLLRTASDTHPPLSYLLYQLWMPLAGRSIFALRFMAVAFGVLTVPVCAAAGRRLAGPYCGLAAAFLLAVARFHVWWSQQIRMYALVGLLCALSMYALFRFLHAWNVLPLPAGVRSPGAAGARARPGPKDVRGQRGLWLAALGVINLAGLFTLYFFAVLVALEGLLVLGSGVAARRKAAHRWSVLGAWLGMQIASITLFLPWLVFFSRHAIRFAGGQTAPLAWRDFLSATWAQLTIGIDTDVAGFIPLLVALGLGLVLLLAVALVRRSHARLVVLWLLLVTAGLPLAAYAVTLQRGLFFSPAYQTRYALPALPALVLLVAVAAAALPGWVRLAPLALSAALALAVLPPMYAASHRTDDYQSLAEFVAAYERPGDVVVFDPDWNFHLFMLDYRGSLPWVAIPLNQPVDTAYADQIFSRWASDYRALWLVQESGGHDAGAEHPVRDWLNAHRRLTLQLTVGDRRVALYDLSDAPARSLDPSFVPQHLTAVPGIGGYDQPLDDVRVGDVLNLALYGRSGCGAAPLPPSCPALPERLTFGGKTFSAVAFPGQAWFSIPVGAWAPAGHPPISAVLPDGSLLPLTSVGVEAHAVASPRSTEPPLANVVARTFGGSAELTSYNAEPQPAHAGQDLSVRLQWQALEPFSQNYTVFVHLLDAAGHVAAQRDSQPAGGRQPTIRWQSGEIIDDDYVIALPAAMPPGSYQIEVGMYLQATGDRLTVDGSGAVDHLILGAVIIDSASSAA